MTRLDQRVFGTVLLALGVLASAAMAQTPPSHTPPQSQSPGPQSRAEPIEEECPPFMKGSKLEVSDAKGGVAVSITTPDRANVEPLREVLREVADAVEEQSRMQTVQAGAEAPPPLDVTTKDIKGGAQMIIRTEDTKNITMLREQARGLETAWATSACVVGGEQSAAR